MIYLVSKVAFKTIYVLISIILLIGANQLIQATPLARLRFQNAILRTGLHNHKGEFPSLSSIHSDREKEHGVIYEVKSVGLSISDFEEKASQIGAALGGRIYGISYAKRTTSRVLLYLLPQKYEKPSVISLESENLNQEPNFLVVGKTGSGKSYALSVLLGIYACLPNVSITICDYKKSSFQFSDTPNFFGYEDVPAGIKAFYQEFTERLQANDEVRNQNIRVLLIDEYGALISAQDKKTSEELKKMVANMLFMGRSLGIRILIGVQRADAAYFQAGARDQFHAILALGNLSREQKLMLFPDYRDSMNECNGVGEGYLLIDGQDIERVQIAEISDRAVLDARIRAAMCR